MVFSAITTSACSILEGITPTADLEVAELVAVAQEDVERVDVVEAVVELVDVVEVVVVVEDAEDPEVIVLANYHIQLPSLIQDDKLCLRPFDKN